ncbi:UDP-N-acetylglucosamine transferase subunit ALG13 [Gillisia sp. Hel_I_86]|uniref:glycosyltransferase n=1 Tax=Gillisia sp. Hel_I_86 TaxID=1249981 RepID=UPI00119A0AB3|nr:glycosyltransferase [Gillisia sp. Hel_I_86]TVZ27531.1 UDP-N-acetylglucosamine transferase subunit ALG13 [Gillisia sp. Hel_I_86]
MIFVTVGTQEPFDRLIKAVDEIIPELEDQEIIVQAPMKSYKPIHFKTFKFIDPIKYNMIFNRADFIISHAGMGTILSAMTTGKTLIIMPRLIKYGEHRNEHQLHTAKKFKSLNYINVVDDENELKAVLLGKNKQQLLVSKRMGEYASDELIDSIRKYINPK